MDEREIWALTVGSGKSTQAFKIGESCAYDSGNKITVTGIEEIRSAAGYSFNPKWFRITCDNDHTVEVFAELPVMVYYRRKP